MPQPIPGFSWLVVLAGFPIHSGEVRKSVQFRFPICEPRESVVNWIACKQDDEFPRNSGRINRQKMFVPTLANCHLDSWRLTDIIRFQWFHSYHQHHSFSGPKEGDFNQRDLKLRDMVGGEYPTTSGGSLHSCTFSSRINSVSTFLPCICILPCRSCTTWAGVTLLSSCMFSCRSCEIQAARCKMHVHLAHVLLQELQDAVGTTVGAGVNLTGQLTRAAVPVAQGIVGAVREVVEVETCKTLVMW